MHELREAVSLVGLPEEVGGELGQRAEPSFALAQRFLGALPLQELADLAADHARSFEQALVGLAQLGAREGEHADRAPFGNGGKAESAADSGAFRERTLANPRIDLSVRAPQRLARCEHFADQAFVRLESQRARSLDELLEAALGHAPCVLEAQHIAFVQLEVASAGPVLGL